MKRIILSVLGVLCFVSFVVEPTVEAKKRRSRSSALQIVQVTTSPSPFEVGNGDLTFSAVVKVPRDLRGVDILEVTALITSPTQRSMRFLSQRLPIGSKSIGQRGSRISTVLVWDGKDQAQTLVKPGTYQYEFRAKLMAENGASIRTRMVSRRSRGTVEVTKYHLPEPLLTPESLPEPSVTPSIDGVEENEEDTVLEGAVSPAEDEIEMLPDESTGHPLPEADEKNGGLSEEGVVEIPQEG